MIRPLLFLTGIFLLTQQVQASDAVNLFYNLRPPYMQLDAEGKFGGLTGTPAVFAFNKAGVKFELKEIPTNRQLYYLKANQAPSCAIGWFKTVEREQFAKYTNPIYQDKPTVLLARKGFKVDVNARLKDVLTIKGLRILVKNNYSYGSFVDGMLEALQQQLRHTTAENATMLKMIAADRADFMFLSEEEAIHLLKETEEYAKDVHIIQLSDIPLGEKRYLMCNKLVADETIERLNMAMSVK